MHVSFFFSTFASFLWARASRRRAPRTINTAPIGTINKLEKHWIKPTLTEQPELLQVKLTLFVQTDDIPQEPTGETRVETMEKSSEKSSEKIIDIIKQSPKITAKEISIVLGISSRGVEKQIKNLREQGILRRIGPDKGGHWEVVE